MYDPTEMLKKISIHTFVKLPPINPHLPIVYYSFQIILSQISIKAI